MKKLLVLQLLIWSLNGYSQSKKNEFDRREYLEWNEFYDLQWHDFEGKPGPEARGDAGTVVQIKAKPFKAGKAISYDVYALFNRKKSWVKDQSTALLKHEQLHFDIAELYARKVRKKIAELQSQGERDLSVYNVAIRELLSESDNVDIQYDAETLHGAMQQKQRNWEKNIKEELEAFKDFRKTKRVIHVN